MDFWLAFLVAFVFWVEVKGEQNGSFQACLKENEDDIIVSQSPKVTWRALHEGLVDSVWNWHRATCHGWANALQPGSLDRGKLPQQRALHAPLLFWCLLWGFCGPGARRTPLVLRACVLHWVTQGSDKGWAWQHKRWHFHTLGYLFTMQKIRVYTSCLPHSRCLISIFIFKEQLWINEST